MYNVKLSSFAKKFYLKADQTLSKKLSKCFLNLQENPYSSNNIKRLSGILRGSYRYRVGDYRVVYDVDESRKIVEVSTIKHRKEVYK